MATAKVKHPIKLEEVMEAMQQPNLKLDALGDTLTDKIGGPVKSKAPKALNQVPFGTLFQIYRLQTCLGDNTQYMRVRCVGHLLNSYLISDVIGRGDSIVLNIDEATLHIMAASLAVKEVTNV